MSQLDVLPIAPNRLAAMRVADSDDLDNPLVERMAEGWEPLRCCLRVSRPGESIALITYSPFEDRTAWSEFGPVFVHLHECAGYTQRTELPSALRTGPRVLRTYHADGSLDYEDTVLVADGEDIEDAVSELLGRPNVAWIHVRAHLSQCFTYEVRRAR